MFSKVLYIFWMDQILFSRVFVVKFLKMVDFVFIFVVAVMTWSQSKVGQLFTRADGFQPLIARDDSCGMWIEDFQDVENGAVFDICGGGY